MKKKSLQETCARLDCIGQFALPVPLYQCELMIVPATYVKKLNALDTPGMRSQVASVRGNSIASRPSRTETSGMATWSAGPWSTCSGTCKSPGQQVQQSHSFECVCRPAQLFQQRHRIGHTENCLSSLSKNQFIGSTYNKKTFNLILKKASRCCWRLLHNSLALCIGEVNRKFFIFILWE